ncbi:exodeoxyribonuclease VII small subunit [Mariniblastus fucicola]|nr:exodeoxyribonuclease VII small subunit [Mariniblastus fucicola]
MAKKKSSKKKAATKDAVAFEASLEALKEILSDLEEGNLPLGESLEKYEAGVKHLRHCHDSLNEAKTRIELLEKIDKHGQAVTKPFDHSATVEETEVSDEEADSLQEELDEAAEDDADWDGGLF